MEVKTKLTGSIVMSEELRSYLDKKIEKLAVFVKNDPTAICEVELSSTSSGHRTGDVYRAEVHMTFAGGDVYADATGATLHASLDTTVSEARRELKKKKGKHQDLMRKGASDVKRFFRSFGK